MPPTFISSLIRAFIDMYPSESIVPTAHHLHHGQANQPLEARSTGRTRGSGPHAGRRGAAARDPRCAEEINRIRIPQKKGRMEMRPFFVFKNGV